MDTLSNERMIALDKHLRGLFPSCTGVSKKGDVYTAQWNGSQSNEQESQAGAIISSWNFTASSELEKQEAVADAIFLSPTIEQKVLQSTQKIILGMINECRTALSLKTSTWEEVVDAAKGNIE